jgi:hypothetical protein
VTNGVKVFAYFNDYVGDYKVGDFVRLTKKSYSPLGRIDNQESGSATVYNLLATWHHIPEFEEPMAGVDGKLRIPCVFNAYIGHTELPNDIRGSSSPVILMLYDVITLQHEVVLKGFPSDAMCVGKVVHWTNYVHQTISGYLKMLVIYNRLKCAAHYSIELKPSTDHFALSDELTTGF